MEPKNHHPRERLRRCQPFFQLGGAAALPLALHLFLSLPGTLAAHAGWPQGPRANYSRLQQGGPPPRGSTAAPEQMYMAGNSAAAGQRQHSGGRPRGGARDVYGNGDRGSPSPGGVPYTTGGPAAQPQPYTGILSILNGAGWGGESSSTGVSGQGLFGGNSAQQRSLAILSNEERASELAREVRLSHERAAQYCCCFSRRRALLGERARGEFREDCCGPPPRPRRGSVQPPLRNPYYGRSSCCDCGGTNCHWPDNGWVYGNDYWSGYQLGMQEGLYTNSADTTPEGTCCRESCCGPCYDFGYADGKRFGANLADHLRDPHYAVAQGDTFPADGMREHSAAWLQQHGQHVHEHGGQAAHELLQQHQAIAGSADHAHIHHLVHHNIHTQPPENLHGDSCCPMGSQQHDFCTLPGDSCCTNDVGKIDGCHCCCTHRPPLEGQDAHCCGLVQPHLGGGDQMHKCCCITSDDQFNPCALCLHTNHATHALEPDICCCWRFCCHTGHGDLACCNPGGCCGGDCGNLDPQHGQLCCDKACCDLGQCGNGDCCPKGDCCGGGGDPAGCAACFACVGAAIAFVLFLVFLAMTAAASVVYNGLMFPFLGLKKFWILAFYTSAPLLLSPVPMQHPLAMVYLDAPSAIARQQQQQVAQADYRLYDLPVEVGATPSPQFTSTLQEAYKAVKAIPVDNHGVRVTPHGHLGRVFEVEEEVYAFDARTSLHHAAANQPQWSWNWMKYRMDALVSAFNPYQMGYRKFPKGTQVMPLALPKGHGFECSMMSGEDVTDELVPVILVAGQWKKERFLYVPFLTPGSSNEALNRQGFWPEINVSKPYKMPAAAQHVKFPGPVPPPGLFQPRPVGPEAADTEIEAVRPGGTEFQRCRNSLLNGGPTECSIPTYWLDASNDRLFKDLNRLRARQLGENFATGVNLGDEEYQEDWPAEMTSDTLTQGVYCAKIRNTDTGGFGGSPPSWLRSVSLAEVPVLTRSNTWVADGSKLVDASQDYKPQNWKEDVLGPWRADHPEWTPPTPSTLGPTGAPAEGQAAVAVPQDQESGIDLLMPTPGEEEALGNVVNRLVVPAAGPPLQQPRSLTSPTPPAPSSSREGYEESGLPSLPRASVQYQDAEAVAEMMGASRLPDRLRAGGQNAAPSAGTDGDGNSPTGQPDGRRLLRKGPAAEAAREDAAAVSDVEMEDQLSSSASASATASSAAYSPMHVVEHVMPAVPDEDAESAQREFQEKQALALAEFLAELKSSNPYDNASSSSAGSYGPPQAEPPRQQSQQKHKKAAPAKASTVSLLLQRLGSIFQVPDYARYIAGGNESALQKILASDQVGVIEVSVDGTEPHKYHNFPDAVRQRDGAGVSEEVIEAMRQEMITRMKNEKYQSKRTSRSGRRGEDVEETKQTDGSEGMRQRKPCSKCGQEKTTPEWSSSSNRHGLQAAPVQEAMKSRINIPPENEVSAGTKGQSLLYRPAAKSKLRVGTSAAERVKGH